MKKYYALETSENNTTLNIFGDITSWPWMDSDVSAIGIIDELKDIQSDHIDVMINSYGGEVSEGLAIYNALKNHKASVTTYCEGFACSIASVIFMAGDERIMEPASLLMIHNPWMYTQGNADQLRKDAEDLDKIAGASKAAYLSGANVGEEALDELLANETYLSPQEALDMGFCTQIAESEESAVSQSAMRGIMERLAKQENPKEHELSNFIEESKTQWKSINEELQQVRKDLEAQTKAVEESGKNPEQPPAEPENKLKKMLAKIGSKEAI